MGRRSALIFLTLNFRLSAFSGVRSKVKKYTLPLLAGSLLLSCAPVLNKSLMSQGIYAASLSEIRESAPSRRGQLYILGGVIVKTTVTKEGSVIEAIFVPVTNRGYLKSYQATTGRFLALYRGRDILDPMIYSEKREITLAGEFVEMRRGTIGETEYTYPLFEIKGIYLWDEIKTRDYYYYPYPPPYYYPWHYRHRVYDPWWPYYY